MATTKSASAIRFLPDPCPPWRKTVSSLTIGIAFTLMPSAFGQSVQREWVGEHSNELFGNDVAAGGDLNGDGVLDFLVGSPSFSTTESTEVGRIHALSGDGSVLEVLIGTEEGEEFGSSVAFIGDVDGDGGDDFAVGASMHSSLGPEAGRVTVFSGKTFAELYHFDGAGFSQLGESVARAGDLDGDGIGDLLVGEPEFDDDGRLLVISGVDGSEIRRHYSFVSWNGRGLASIGDVNGDGVPEYASGNFRYYENRGSVSLFDGATGNLLQFWTGNPGDAFGFDVTAVGDIDGDLIPDLLVGSPHAFHRSKRLGKATIYSGLGPVIQNHWGPESVSWFGYRVQGLGRFTDDAVPDYAILTKAPGMSYLDWELHFYRGDNHSSFAVRDTYGDGRYGLACTGDTDGDGMSEVVFGMTPYGEPGRVMHLAPCHGGWLSYGAGWPGADGVPSLTCNGDPVLDTTITLQFGNARGVSTAMIAFLGAGPGNMLTNKGGRLLVNPLLTLSNPLPATGLELNFPIGTDPGLCGTKVYLQHLHADPMASHGMAFSQGMELQFGYF